ncbi:hypothetical protein DH2020_025374 [Rehmannia glutinosa]|uniref:Uncharacterized protein n=1 Tax=Rehmannia glutinosa TaxID=99300 RepID=A0ABR0W448_REHGL
MVNYMLMITADLENLTDLQPQGGCDGPNFTYYFKLKCGNCGEVTQKETCVSLNETVPSAKGKSDTNLAQKCKFCSRDGTVSMITGRGRPLTQEQAETGKYAPLMLFDCRGYEPVDFVFGSGWKAESFELMSHPGENASQSFVIEGTKFNDIDLSAGEFANMMRRENAPS